MTETRLPRSSSSTTLAVNSVSAFTYADRIVMLVVSLLCYAVYRGLAGIVDFPSAPGFTGSLLAGPSAVLVLVFVIFAIALSLIVGAIAAALIQDEAALFCCCVGLAGISIRAGTIRPVLQYSAGPTVFVALAIEVVCLSAAVVAGWVGLRFVLAMLGTDAPVEASTLGSNELVNPTLQDRLTTTGIQVLVMAIVEMILVQSDTKAQALAGVGVAGFLGALAAYKFTNVAEVIWYLPGPAIVAVIGYGLAFAGSAASASGDLHGMFATLARPVPLDYAGVGIAGVLMGYWSARNWSIVDAELTPDELTNESAPTPAA